MPHPGFERGSTIRQFLLSDKTGKFSCIRYKHYLKVELLVYSEVYSNELGFSSLSSKILFYKRVKWFITFYDKIKALIESKDFKIYF